MPNTEICRARRSDFDDAMRIPLVRADPDWAPTASSATLLHCRTNSGSMPIAVTVSALRIADSARPKAFEAAALACPWRAAVNFSLRIARTNRITAPTKATWPSQG